MSDSASFPELDGSQACRDEDPELFFPGKGDSRAQIAAAKRVCEGCPLRRPCLAFALTHAVHGIWGGTTEAERAALQRQHGLPKRVGWSGKPLTDFDDDTED